jgi:hypothetical protein
MLRAARLVQFFDDEAQCFAFVEEMRPFVIEDSKRQPINKIL